MASLRRGAHSMRILRRRSTSHLLHELPIRLPVVQAPMLGHDSPELAAAVCSAGGLGSLALANTAPEAIAGVCESLFQLIGAGQPYNVNFFVLDDPPTPGTPEASEYEQRSADFFAPFRTELGLERPPTPARYGHSFKQQMEALLALEYLPPVVSFTFGCPPREVCAELERRGVLTVGTATSAEEAAVLCEAGVLAVVAQGVEAGGHRGTFLHPFESAMVGTMALVPAVVDECGASTPVIAAGGIADGRGVAAAIALGAQAVQVGTAYLATNESSAAEAHRTAVAQATALDAHTKTVVASSFSGRPARGFAGRVTHHQQVSSLHGEKGPAPYPVHDAMSRDLRAAAARSGRRELMPMWVGQAVDRARGGEGAAALTRRLVLEAADAANFSARDVQKWLTAACH